MCVCAFVRFYVNPSPSADQSVKYYHVLKSLFQKETRCGRLFILALCCGW